MPTVCRVTCSADDSPRHAVALGRGGGGGCDDIMSSRLGHQGRLLGGGIGELGLEEEKDQTFSLEAGETAPVCLNRVKSRLQCAFSTVRPTDPALGSLNPVFP